MAVPKRSEIQPGMRGYGLTVFRGTEPEKFEFEVRGIVPDFSGWPRVIVVQLFGGPKDKDGKNLFDSGQIFGGNRRRRSDGYRLLLHLFSPVYIRRRTGSCDRHDGY